MRRRTAIIAAVAAIAIIAAGAAWYQGYYAPMRETIARRGSDSMAALEAVVSAAPGPYAASYTAELWNPRTSAIADVDVYKGSDSTYDMRVTVEWNPVSGSSRVLSMKRVAPPK